LVVTLQPTAKDDFINRESILNEILSTFADERTRMGFALVGQRKAGKA
jgi:AAA+ ATPase superfamily predicted ATPase